MMQRETPSTSATPDVVAHTQLHSPRLTSKLFHHTPHLHQPQNVNVLHAAEQKAEGFNTRVAVMLTKSVGTMWTAYSFAVLAFIGLFAILNLLPPIVILLVAFISQTFLQLVLLPVIMVGQNVLGRKAELQSDEMFQTSQHSFHDIEEIIKHLDKQDEAILEILKLLEAKKESDTVGVGADSLEQAARPQG